MRKIMIDIESLGTKSTSVILSIGAIAFDESGHIGQGFYQRVDIDSCLQRGLTVDGKTIEWWMDQSAEARAVFTEPAKPLSAVLIDLGSAYDWNDTEIWANGSNFDIPILENAYNACGLVIPWKFWNVRDYRTVKNMFSKEFFNTVCVEPVVAHHALEDARAQALTLQALLDARHNLISEEAA